MIRELRQRYLDGTIDDVLVPEDASIDALLDDLKKSETAVPLAEHDGGEVSRAEEIA